MDGTEERLARMGIRRCPRLGVGKRMGSAVWVHAPLAAEVFGAAAVGAALDRAGRPDGYAAVRYDERTREVCLLWSADFDEAHEPTVDGALLVRPDGTVRRTGPSASPLVWHHKWTFVRPGYAGFDVARAMERSLEWRAAVGTDRGLSSRIGRAAYWDALLERLGLEPRLPLPAGPRP